MSRLLLVLLLGSSFAVWAQSSNSSSSPPANTAPEDSKTPDSKASPDTKPIKLQPQKIILPHSDSVNASDLNDEPGQSSSKDTQVDLSPPPDDAKAHPQGSEMLMDEGTTSGSGDVKEFHPWDPHKAAKDIEVGDFYFKAKKNYRAAEDRYREALYYKDNDATATFRLAVCLEKLDRPDEARQEYENYLKILPHGPQVEEATKAIERLKAAAAKAAQ